MNKCRVKFAVHEEYPGVVFYADPFPVDNCRELAEGKKYAVNERRDKADDKSCHCRQYEYRPVPFDCFFH